MYSLLLVLLLLDSVSADRLQIYNSEYVKICCGEPCEWLTFRLNRTLSAILIHNYKYIATSRTYLHSENGGRDSEFFQFDDGTRYLFQVYPASQPSGLQTKDALPADGTLGLGDGSPLWEVWPNYTLSQRRLSLGEYDYYSQFSHSQRPPVINLNEVTHVTLGDKSILPIDFSVYSVETYIPYPLNTLTALANVTLSKPDCLPDYELMFYEKTMQSHSFKCSSSNTLMPNKQQSIELLNGVDYTAVKYTSQHVFIPGARFFTEFFWFKNIITNQLIITQDVFCMDYDAVTIYASIFIALSLGFWCQIAQSKTERKDNFEFFFTQMAEATCYTLDWIVLLVTFGMLNWGRYLSHYTSTDFTFAQTFIMIMCTASLGNWFYGLFASKDYVDYSKNFKRKGLFHAVLLVTSQMLIIWLCFIKQHETSFDRFASGFILMVTVIFQLFAFLWFCLSQNYICALFTGIIGVTTNIFNILYNIKPIFVYSGFRNQFASFCVISIYFLEILPAVLILISAYSYKFRKAASPPSP